MDDLFPVWRHHAVFTDSPFETVQAEGLHRRHAVVEQVFADVTSGLLAYMPPHSAFTRWIEAKVRCRIIGS